jgi:hypothetical protein
MGVREARRLSGPHGCVPREKLTILVGLDRGKKKPMT